jgi:hypothetical protein
MPLFSGKFAFKKSPARKLNPISLFNRELTQSYTPFDYNSNEEPIKIELGKQILSFDTKIGEWITSNTSNDLIKDSQLDKMNDLRNKNELLQQENRLLKLKLEILMQMVSQLVIYLYIF